MTYSSRRRPVAPLPGCDLCGDVGRLELKPLPDGRWACPCCRYDLERRREAAARKRVIETFQSTRRLTARPTSD